MHETNEVLPCIRLSEISVISASLATLVVISCIEISFCFSPNEIVRLKGVLTHEPVSRNSMKTNNVLRLVIMTTILTIMTFKYARHRTSMVIQTSDSQILNAMQHFPTGKLLHVSESILAQ